MPTRRRGRPRAGTALWFWVFVGPFFAGLVLFIYVPIGWSVYLSFFEAYNTVTPTEFVGLANYRDMLGDRAFRESLLTFVVFAAFIVPTTFALSLLTAVLVARTRVMQAFFRSVFFLPVACSYVVAALIWKMSIFSGMRSGVANAALGLVGVDPIPWLSLTDPPWYWLVIVSARLWLQVGFYMILFLAALQRIPTVLYEAAAIDGAEGWQVFRHITWPQLLPASTAVLLLLLINAFQAFDEFYNILSSFGSYPPYARPPLVYLYYTALGSGQNFGDGSAGAVILTLMIAVVALLQTRVLRLGGRD
ncbi:sugar ABC transporter, permease protein [Serinicoccus hydrothermalis]|uniref:Sugar ABC transporter, permease protein n=1 Tax=Serinicoccus hydrothermalis TaxID=1758689 RepID=A0A1B1N9M3_9MICO|nr:sugar ABC transporter permease [Serinicoccus hydrothermalis]ANS78150.1 sugar ABC transporter, permease protein [Serinicoccus hydrothermalis]